MQKIKIVRATCLTELEEKVNKELEQIEKTAYITRVSEISKGYSTETGLPRYHDEVYFIAIHYSVLVNSLGQMTVGGLAGAIKERGPETELDESGQLEAGVEEENNPKQIKIEELLEKKAE